MNISTELQELADEIVKATRNLEEAKRSLKQDKQLRQTSIWARFVDFFTTTQDEVAVENASKRLASVMATAGKVAEQWICAEARSCLLRSSVDASRHSAQVQRTADALLRHNRVLPILRLAETAHSQLDLARRDCDSASSIEMLDLISKNKAVSVWSSMETSSAAESIGKASRAVKALVEALPQRAEVASIDAPSDLLDLFVDIAFQPAFDILSWFNMGRLDDAARQCMKASEKLDPLLSQLTKLSTNTASRLSTEAEALRSIEAPYLQAAAALVPGVIQFKVPKNL